MADHHQVQRLWFGMSDVQGDEIVYWFEVTSTPAGGAPQEIRDRWMGIVLPVRRPRPPEGPEPHVGRHVRIRAFTYISDGVAVTTADALKALELFGRPDAAAWWERYFTTRPATVALVFRTSEGRLLPSSYALLRYPELEAFGSDLC